MKRFFDISRYPVIVVFALAGISVVIVTFVSYNLVQLGMANLHYVSKFGWLALKSGAILQLLQLLVYGAIALFFFILFKICESDLVIRYRSWKDR